MIGFVGGLFLLCASTLMYEIVLARLLGVITWYYLAFVAISMAMFGMTLGALIIQLRPDVFPRDQAPQRMAQATLAMAMALPLTLIGVLAVPIELTLTVQSLFSFLLFSTIVAVPFLFAGIAVCLSLTMTSFPINRVYFIDLLGSAAGCVGAVAVLSLIDAPSAFLLIAALLFLAAFGYATHAGDARIRRRALIGSAAMLIATAANASTYHGIQPIWVKASVDGRRNLLVEVWNPVYQVRAERPSVGPAQMWAPSPRMPATQVETIRLRTDGQTGTFILPFQGDVRPFDFLRFDVPSAATPLRKGGSAAIIGVGGGRDVLFAHANGYRRIVGIELNRAMVDVTARRLDWYSGFSRIPGFELHADEGRSFLARTNEQFDLIQAALADSWVAASAGAMSLSENSLYTVEGLQTLYSRLKPGGLISICRWNSGPESFQTHRLFAMAWALLLIEHVPNPAAHLAVVGSGRIATLILSNAPLSAGDLRHLENEARDLQFDVLYLPGRSPAKPEFRAILAATSLEDLQRFRYTPSFDYSPVFDSSPFFFNGVRLWNLRLVARGIIDGGHARAVGVLLCFFVAALILVAATIVVPVLRLKGKAGAGGLSGAVVYFVAIGIGFMLIEIGIMQQLSILLGHPTYALVVVLAGIIFSTGIGSLVSGRMAHLSAWTSRLPALAVVLVVVVYAASVFSAMDAMMAAGFGARVVASLALIVPCGLAMGFCFPVGLRWAEANGHADSLPWMWALNGAASVLATFLAIVIAMEASTRACVLAGAACYLLAGIALPRMSRESAPETALRQAGPAM